MARAMTYKQRLFVHAYLGEAHGNATGAARMAGYSNPEIGRQLLRKITIRAALAARLAGPALSADEVLARLSEQAAADLGDFADLIRYDDEGRLTVDLPAARRRGLSRLIRKLTPTPSGVTLELHDAQAALEKLGRYHGLFRTGRDAHDPDRDDARGRVQGKLDRLAAAGPEEGVRR